MVDALLLLLTFALGTTLARVSLCAVAGMQQLLTARDGAGVQRLALAASGAGAVLLLLAGVAPDRVLLPTDVPFHWGIIGGGLLLGAGALVNGGCYLGSVLYLGSGNLNFLLTLIGIALGARAAEFSTALSANAAPGLRMTMGPLWVVGLTLFAALAMAMLYRSRFQGRWLAAWAGVLAGLVYARHPAWSYGSVIEALAHGRVSAMDWRANLSALLLFAGALAGAWLAGRFQWQWPTPWRALRCLAGGSIMGLGAALVPGGNDALLLWAIPGLTAYGALAYGSMLAAIGAGLALRAGRQRRKPLVP
jgi:toxin CptA